jgi:hypothetical protein
MDTTNTDTEGTTNADEAIDRVMRLRHAAGFHRTDTYWQDQHAGERSVCPDCRLERCPDHFVGAETLTCRACAGWVDPFE